jgi:hypothetical protein
MKRIKKFAKLMPFVAAATLVIAGAAAGCGGGYGDPSGPDTSQVAPSH